MNNYSENLNLLFIKIQRTVEIIFAIIGLNRFF